MDQRRGYTESQDSLNSEHEQNELKLNDRMDSEPLIQRTKGNIDLKVSKDALMSLNKQNEGVVGDTDFINFTIEIRNIIFGTQKWALTHFVSDRKEEINPFVEITRVDVEYFDLYTNFDGQKHRLVSSDDTGKFLEFFLWSKKKTIFEQIKSKEFKDPIETHRLIDRQKINVDLDCFKLFINNDSIETTSMIAEDIISSINSQSQNLASAIQKLSKLSTSSKDKDKEEPSVDTIPEFKVDQKTLKFGLHKF